MIFEIMANSIIQNLDEYIEQSKTICSYKYVLLYLCLHELKVSKKIIVNNLADKFILYYQIRKDSNQTVEKESCQPLKSNPKKIMATPMNIFLEDGIIITQYDDLQSGYIIEFRAQPSESSTNLLKNKILDYFMEIASSPKQIETEILNQWIEECNNKVSHKTESDPVESYIWVTTQFEGFHKYPAAPDEVKFLRDSHRHIFHIKVWIQVFHDDRDIEFILFKRFVQSLLKTNNFNFKSCEMISDDLHNMIANKYPNRKMRIEVSEDKENGSFKIYS